MTQPTLISECKTDAEKIRLWRDLLKSEDMTIKSAVTMIREDALGDWIPGEDNSGSYFTIPGFQRDYTYSSKQKTSLIESILLNIPIGSILVYQETKDDGTRMLPIIDGQHRLKTIYDFVCDRFKLNGKHLSFLHSLEGKKFSDLEPEFKHNIYDYTLTVLKARNTGEDIENTVEEFSNQCFIRMNENPNTMSPYTLLRAKFASAFFSEFDQMLNVVLKRDKELRKMFSISGKGKGDKYKLDITAIISTIKNGLHPKMKDMKSTAELFICGIEDLNDEEKTESLVEELANVLSGFNIFLQQFSQFGVQQPLTHQILGEKPDYFVNLKKGIMVRMALVYYILSNAKETKLTEKKFSVIREAFREAYRDDATLRYNSLKHFEDIFRNFYAEEIGSMKEEVHA